MTGSDIYDFLQIFNNKVSLLLCNIKILKIGMMTNNIK